MLIVHGLLLAIRCHARFGASGLVASADLNDPSVSQVTIRCLLQHTAGGWSNAAPDPMMSNAGLSHSALIIRTVTADPAQRLSAPPGTRHAYSNFGYCVLARCIEARDPQHRNYATHVQHEVLDRMGLAASDEFAFAMSEQAPVSKEASAYCTRPALPPGANAAPVEPAWIIADASPGPDQDQSRRSLAWTRTGAGSRPDSDRAHRTLRRDHEGGVTRQPRPRARMVCQPGPQQRVAHWQPSGHERNDDIDRCARRFGLIRPCVFRCCAHL